MPETMLLIPGRSSKQGTSLNAGKLGAEYIEVTSTVEMNSDDMTRLGLTEGDMIRMSTDIGECIVKCKARKPAELPAGMLFMAYGPLSSQLVGGETQGTGMPLSKGFDVEVEKITGDLPATNN
jgi:formylmethanofuran dehydrogenase subunit D